MSTYASNLGYENGGAPTGREYAVPLDSDDLTSLVRAANLVVLLASKPGEKVRISLDDGNGENPSQGIIRINTKNSLETPPREL
jgi:hypothetical protein